VTYKPVKLWDIKVVVRENFDEEVAEKRGTDWDQKVLQIPISTFECKSGESGEDKACGQRQRSACWVEARLRVIESKFKGFESGHHCQGSGHSVG